MSSETFSDWEREPEPDLALHDFEPIPTWEDISKNLEEEDMILQSHTEQYSIQPDSYATFDWEDAGPLSLGSETWDSFDVTKLPTTVAIVSSSTSNSQAVDHPIETTSTACLAKSETIGMTTWPNGQPDIELEKYHPSSSSEPVNAHGSLKKGRRRPWEESIMVFSARSGQGIIQRPRRKFSAKRREEVALNRIVGNCLQCQIRKGRCNFGSPCDFCLRRAGDCVSMAQEICLRQQLVATCFDHLVKSRLYSEFFSLCLPVEDLFSECYYTRGADQLGINRLQGKQQYAYVEIGYRPWSGDKSGRTYLKVPVIAFESDTEPEHIVLDVDYYGTKERKMETKSLAIVWKEFPSLDAIISCFENSYEGGYPFRSPLGRLQRATRDFVGIYYDLPQQLPLKKLIGDFRRLRSLFSIFECYPEVAIFIAKESHSLELYILLEVQKWAQGLQQKCCRENPIAVWISLWTLIFTYRDHMMHLNVFNVFYEDNFGSPNPELAQNYTLAHQMYRSLVSIYAFIFRTTSPLNLDWRTEEVSQMLGNDKELIGLWSDIKTEMFWFYSEREKLFPVDDIMKVIVIENEKKLHEAHLRAAKKKGLL